MQKEKIPKKTLATFLRIPLSPMLVKLSQAKNNANTEIRRGGRNNKPSSLLLDSPKEKRPYLKAKSSNGNRMPLTPITSNTIFLCNFESFIFPFSNISMVIYYHAIPTSITFIPPPNERPQPALPFILP